MQGIIKAYNPQTRDGIILCDTNLLEYELAAGALEGTIFRMLRPGQRINFDINDQNLAINIRIGSEVDMSTPEEIQS